MKVHICSTVLKTPNLSQLRRRVNIFEIQYATLNTLTRVAIISILPAKNISNAELEAELKKRLQSKSFSVDHIAILDDEPEGPIPAESVNRNS
jgi:hypothetical protein